MLDTLHIPYGTTRQSRKHCISSANGSPLNCLGSVNLKIFFEGRVTSINALVTDDLQENLLISWKDLQRMHILPEDFPHVMQQSANALHTSSPESLDDLLSEFQDVFNEETVTPMAGDPMHIHIRKDRDGYRPLRTKIARKTPKHFQKEAEKLIQHFVDSGVIVKVPANENVEWCSPGFFVPKPNGKVRLVVDYRQINKFIDRPVHPFPSCRDILHNIKSDSRWFLKFDAAWGYYQMPLDEESSRLTTFLVESGRYRFTRVPLGLNPSSDYFCERSDLAFDTVTDLLKIVDDGLIQAPTKQDLLKNFRHVLECCRKYNLTLSKSKVQMGESVLFAGYEITKDGVKPDQKKTDGIRKFPVPTNISELRSFLGLVNQLGIFIPDLAHLTQDLRGLLRKNVAYLWLPEHQEAFEKIKDILCSPMLIKPFSSDLTSTLLTDASRLHGLGYALIQRNKENTSLSLVQCGSRSLNSAETRYSTTELECLAIYYAIKDCSFYLQGIPFTVVTDHKPLLGTFKKPLSEIENARLLRFREKLTNFDFAVEYAEGKSHLIADALSRAPVFDPPEAEEISTHAVHTKLASDPCLQFLYEDAAKDKQYQSIVKALIDGKTPSCLPPGHPAHQFRSLWDDLSVYDDILLVLNDSRLVVPKDSRPQILEKLHASHSGISKTRQLAKQLYYWPGISTAIQNMIEDCDECQTLRPSQHEIAEEHPPADRPMHSVSLDLFENAGKHFLVMVDRYSYFIWVQPLNSLSTTTVTNILDRWFLDYGYPFIIISDNGPQFRGEFRDYCEKHNIIHSPSSPYNPRSNGLAEAAVKSAKTLLLKSDNFKDFQNRLLEWRNVPLSNSNMSPAQLFFSRRQRTCLPSVPPPSLPTPPTTDNSILKPLSVGDVVRVQHPSLGTWGDRGQVINIRDSGLSYDVKLDNGDILHRGRRLLKQDAAAARSSTPLTPSADPQRAGQPSATPQLRASLSTHDSPTLDTAGQPPPSDSQPARSSQNADQSQRSIASTPPSAPLAQPIPPILRRGTRNRRQKKIFDPSH